MNPLSDAPSSISGFGTSGEVAQHMCCDHVGSLAMTASEKSPDLGSSMQDHPVSRDLTIVVQLEKEILCDLHKSSVRKMEPGLGLARRVSR